MELPLLRQGRPDARGGARRGEEGARSACVGACLRRQRPAPSAAAITDGGTADSTSASASIGSTQPPTQQLSQPEPPAGCRRRAPAPAGGHSTSPPRPLPRPRPCSSPRTWRSRWCVRCTTPQPAWTSWSAASTRPCGRRRPPPPTARPPPRVSSSRRRLQPRRTSHSRAARRQWRRARSPAAAARRRRRPMPPPSRRPRRRRAAATAARRAAGARAARPPRPLCRAPCFAPSSSRHAGQQGAGRLLLGCCRQLPPLGCCRPATPAPAACCAPTLPALPPATTPPRPQNAEQQGPEGAAKQAWVVQPALRQRYGLAEELPPELAQALAASVKKPKKKLGAPAVFVGQLCAGLQSACLAGCPRVAPGRQR